MSFQNFMNKKLSRWGYELFKIPKLKEDKLKQKMEGYERVRPLATYAPWVTDVEFLNVYERIKKNTLVDKYRCYELWTLLGQCKDIEGDVLEVGLWRGGTSGIICKRFSQINDKKQIFLCDTFTGVVKATSKDSEYYGGEHADTSEEMVESLLGQLETNNYIILKGTFPDETASYVKSNKFSFVHIDVDVYQSAKDILNWVWPKLSVGAIVVFDDYGFNSCGGITELVNEYIGTPGSLIVHNLNGHAIMIKTK